MTIKEAQELVDQWIKTYGVRYFSELTNMAILAEEVGEVARVMARRYGDQSCKPGDDKALADELADVLWVLICIANQTGIDLTEQFRKNIEKKTHLCYIIEKKDKDGNIVKDELLFGGERIKVTNNNIDDYINSTAWVLRCLFNCDGYSRTSRSGTGKCQVPRFFIYRTSILEMAFTSALGYTYTWIL